MNKTAIKNFAVWARVALIEAVKQRAYEFEITDGSKNDPTQEQVNGRPLSRTEKLQREQLIGRINENSFESVMEEAAYTWFNRFTALRYMEVNGYLPSRVKVFTNEKGEFRPELLSEAVNVELSGIDRAKIIELLDAQENEQLYKYLLITQCNDLNSGLPELFEQIGGWTELLFPNNILRADGVLARMISDIPEEDWRDQVQIIGWLYQYYNSEVKDKVFADLKKNIKISADNIPAATQLFTPDWIVRYMVENSLGRLWEEGHGKPASADWRYYLEEAEQEESVKAELEKLREEYRGIAPEQIKVLDPCMGSGHILVYAFDVLMDIYTECGWSERDAAKSILSKNLYGLDIDRRAYQMAYFALMMKARQYNRRILNGECAPNLANFQDVGEIATDFLQGALKEFALQFRHADTYGSLMEIHEVEGLDEALDRSGGLLAVREGQLRCMMMIYRILGQRYDVVCTNPPYMGGSGMNGKLSDFVKKNFPDSKSDLFACFIEKCGQLIKENGFYAMITQHAWMFLSSYENLRKKLMNVSTVNMAHLGARAFDEIGGEVVQTTAFVDCGRKIADFAGTYARLVDIVGENEKRDLFLSGDKRYAAKKENFSRIPGMPVAYWVSENFVRAFENESLYNYAISPSQNVTGNNNKYVKKFWELSNFKIGKKDNWIFYAKGGGYRKWWGNLFDVVNWTPEARNIYQFGDGKHASQIINIDYWYKKGITWGLITSSAPSFRIMPEGATFDKGGSTVIINKEIYNFTLGILNSKVYYLIATILNPTLNFQVKDICSTPLIMKEKEKVDSLVEENIRLSQNDWDSFETSWNFKKHPLI